MDPPWSVPRAKSTIPAANCKSTWPRFTLSSILQHRMHQKIKDRYGINIFGRRVKIGPIVPQIAVFTFVMTYQNYAHLNSLIFVQFCGIMQYGGWLQSPLFIFGPLIDDSMYDITRRYR